jgi:glycylpeptide N-tetradecanoyltransferase
LADATCTELWYDYSLVEDAGEALASVPCSLLNRSLETDEGPEVEDGPIKTINLDEIPSEPSPLIEGFHWVTMDLTDPKEARHFSLYYQFSMRLHQLTRFAL